MFRLLEINKANDKESQAIYPFEDFTAMEAEYESKLGANMKSDSVQAEILIMLDDGLGTIKVAKVGESEIQPRLIEIKTTDSEVADIMKYDTKQLVSANFHSRLGAAMKNEAVKVEVLKGIDGHGNEIEHRAWIRPIEPVEPEEPQEVEGE